MAIGDTDCNLTDKTAGRTAPREARREQLIQSTIESIGKHGMSGTTMKTVTGIAGMSMGIVNFHFQSKETLYKETLRYLGEEHSDQWRWTVSDTALSASDKLLAIVDAHFHPDICNRKKLAVWFAFYGEAANRAAYREIMSTLDDERLDYSRELCRQIIKEGGYRNLTPEGVADTLEGLYDGFYLNIMIYPDSFSRDDAKTRIHQFLATTFPDHFPRRTS